MKKVVVIGCGFAGLSAARHLARHSGLIETAVIDKRATSDFLPMLPDMLGRALEPAMAAFPIESLSRYYGFAFIRDEAVSLELPGKCVRTKQSRIPYDYLIIASGSQTNFYGNDALKKYAYTLDEVADAQRLREVLAAKRFDSCIIAGGGYTGIEVAANIRAFFREQGHNTDILIVERAAAILGPLPEWMKRYAADTLKDLRVEVSTNTVIQSVDSSAVVLSNGRVVKNALLIWAAGVNTSVFIQDLNVPKNPQGRLKVDPYLRVNEDCFAAGDAAYVAHQSAFLRMAVQFAIAQGRAAAQNVLCVLRGKPLKAYAPVDLGYIIPMANNRACGCVLGANLKGILPLWMHYAMCVYRTIGMHNRLRIIGRLINQDMGIGIRVTGE